MASGYDGRAFVERHAAFKDTEYCRVVDEDFQGILIDVTHKWRLALVGAGTIVVVDDVANGVASINTTAAGTNGGAIDQNNIRVISPALECVFCARVQVLTVANENLELKIGIVDVDGTDNAYFFIDRSVHGDLSMHAEIDNNGAQTWDEDTTVVLDAAWHTYEIWYNPVDTFTYFYIDGVEVSVSGAADLDETEFFQPYVSFVTEDANDKNCDVDFIKVWQRRA
jgi:hypothetical protein